MKLGIVCATPEERHALLEQFGFQLDPSHIHGSTRIWLDGPDIHGHQIVFAEAGIGKVNAAVSATLLLQTYDCAALIFSGVAGAISDKLKVGDIVLGTGFAIVDYGILNDEGFRMVPYGSLPITAPTLATTVPVSGEVSHLLFHLQTALADIDAQVELGGILTADYFLNDKAERASLFHQFQALAFDMESAAVFQVSQSFSRPLFVIRTISDSADDQSHISYQDLAAFAARNSALAVNALLPII